MKPGREPLAFLGALASIAPASCPDFVWTHAYSRFLAEDGAEILQVEVIEAGRRR
jgi:hypothetical protein